MTISNIAFGSKTQITNNNAPVTFKSNDDEPVKNSSGYYTRKDSYAPEKQEERKNYEASKQLEKENAKEINKLVLSVCENEEPLTEENKQKLDNSITELFKNSKLTTKQQEAIKKMIFKTLEEYPNFSDKKKAELKQKLKDVENSPFSSKNAACMIFGVLLALSTGGGYGVGLVIGGLISLGIGELFDSDYTKGWGVG